MGRNDVLIIIVIVLVSIPVLVVAGIILYILLKKRIGPKRNEKKLEKAQAQYTPEQLKFLQTVETLFRENRIMPLLQVYEECGIPHEIVCGGNSVLIDDHIPFEKGSEGDNIFKTYAYAINKRYVLSTAPLLERPCEVLNLHPNEKIYHVIYDVVLYEEKVLKTNITYSGIGFTGGLIQFGTLNLRSKEFKNMNMVDSGDLIFTNTRLIFFGKFNNEIMHVNRSDIIYNTLYQDCVMVHVSDRKPMLFGFPEIKNFDTCEITDGVNEFALVFERIRNGNYLQHLVVPQQLVDRQEHLSTEPSPD